MRKWRVKPENMTKKFTSFCKLDHSLKCFTDILKLEKRKDSQLYFHKAMLKGIC